MFFFGGGGGGEMFLPHRLAPVLKTIFHLCVISYTGSQSNSDGSVLKQNAYTIHWNAQCICQ